MHPSSSYARFKKQFSDLSVDPYVNFICSVKVNWFFAFFLQYNRQSQYVGTLLLSTDYILRGTDELRRWYSVQAWVAIDGHTAICVIKHQQVRVIINNLDLLFVTFFSNWNRRAIALLYFLNLQHFGNLLFHQKSSFLSLRVGFISFPINLN